MARIGRTVVQVERLRDQLYELIRDDLKSGAFEPGQRLLEVELADKYKVSRTPVREALFQLSRDGLLAGNDRGYIAPIYTAREAMERLEVKRLLEPPLAEHAVNEADAEEIRKLVRFHEQEQAAHVAGRVRAFNKANADFRVTFRNMCKNVLLVRCATMVDDQFGLARNHIHELADNRIRSINHNAALLAAAQAHDATGARNETTAFLDYLAIYYREHSKE